MTAGRRVLGVTVPPMKQFGPMLVVWGAAMGTLLITGGMLELIRLQRHRPMPALPPAALPLTGFALALIAIPVAAAT